MMRSRSWRRLGRWAALFALALQIGLAFGHIHPLVAGKDLVAAAAPQPSRGDPQKTGDAAQDICAICVSIHLASTLVLPQAAAIAVPARTPDFVDPGGSEFVLPRLPPHPFQTRAPPSA